MAATLTRIPLEALGARAGRVPGRGHVHETEAAWELFTEAMDPFLADLRRLAELRLTDPAARVAVGILVGLHDVRVPDDGSVLAYAGPDCPGELAHEILDEAERLAITITTDEMADAICAWLDLD